MNQGPLPAGFSKIAILLLLLVTLGTAAFYWLNRPKPVTVTVHSVASGTVEDSIANTRAGTIKACRRAGISPAIGGQIARLPVREGDTVEAGQVLVELWNDDLRAQLAQAENEAKATRASAAQTCIMADVASREAQRQERLRKSNLTSEEAVDRADGDARAQQAACRAAKAQQEVRAAAVAVAKAKLDRTRLSAPFAGIVAQRNGEIGEFVTPSPVGIPTPPTIDLVDVDCLYVSAPIDEVDAPGIRVGMAARITLDAMADRHFDGRVRRIAPYVLEREKQARTVDVEVDFLCPEDCAGMLPGYSADIEVILDERSGVLRIPSEAVQEGNRVYVLDDDGILHQRDIETGLSNWNWTEVTGGLRPAETVVLSVEREGVADGAQARAETTAGK